MAVSPLIRSFFTTQILDNSGLEALGNSFCQPFNNSYYSKIEDKKYTKISWIYRERNFRFKIGLAISMSYVALPIFGIISGIRNQSINKFFQYAVLYPFLLFVTGVALKALSWLSPKVREQNWKLVRLRGFEEKNLSPLLLIKRGPSISSDPIVNSSDRISVLPRDIKRLIMENFSVQDVLKIAQVSRTWKGEIYKSTAYLNKFIVREQCRDLLGIISREKLEDILSKPPIKLNPGDSLGMYAQMDLTMYNHTRKAYKLGEIAKTDVWCVDIDQMKGQPIVWGKKLDGTLFFAFLYRNRWINRAGALPERPLLDVGMTILLPNKNEASQSPVQIIHAVLPHEEFQGDMSMDSFFQRQKRIHCYIVGKEVLAVPDYLPRLLSGQPCGICRKDGNQAIVEGPRTFVYNGIEYPVIKLWDPAEV